MTWLGFSTPHMIFSRVITTIDTELSHVSDDAMFVRAKMDFGNNEHIRAFPNDIGNWSSRLEYDTSSVAASLGADVMLMRAYRHPSSSDPITSDTFTMIRVSAPAPLEGSYDEILNLTAEFMGGIIPCMFELRKEELIFFSLFDSLLGKVVVGLLFLVPLLIMFYPEIKRLRKV